MGEREQGQGQGPRTGGGLSGCVQTWLPCPFLPHVHYCVSTQVSTLTIIFGVTTKESNRGLEAGRGAETLQSCTKDLGPRSLLNGGFSPVLTWPLTGVFELPALPGWPRPTPELSRLELGNNLRLKAFGK